MEKTLVIGAGEIGKSLANVLGKAYQVDVRDLIQVNNLEEHYDVIHICYPYSENFVEITKEYIKQYTPKLTIVHSTVRPGTTRKIGGHIVHSPVCGRHPHLEQGIETFVKFIGGMNSYDAFDAVQFLKKAGIKTNIFSTPEATELAKILCTTYFGWNLIYMKEVLRICEKFNLPFHEVYTDWNTGYNNGYLSMGEQRFFRPNLYPMTGPIGGHCVINNTYLLDDWVTDIVKGRNKLYGGKNDRIKNESLAAKPKQHTGRSRNRKSMCDSQPHMDRRKGKDRR